MVSAIEAYHEVLVQLHRESRAKVAQEKKDTPPKPRKSKSWREKLIINQLEKMVETQEIAWLQSVRVSTTAEDHQGIDIVVVTDAGDLRLQVLATLNGKYSGLPYWLRHQRSDDIGVLWVGDSFKKKPEKAKTFILKLLIQLRHRKLHIWTW